MVSKFNTFNGSAYLAIDVSNITANIHVTVVVINNNGSSNGQVEIVGASWLYV